MKNDKIKLIQKFSGNYQVNSAIVSNDGVCHFIQSAWQCFSFVDNDKFADKPTDTPSDFLVEPSANISWNLSDFFPFYYLENGVHSVNENYKSSDYQRLFIEKLDAISGELTRVTINDVYLRDRHLYMEMMMDHDIVPFKSFIVNDVIYQFVYVNGLQGEYSMYFLPHNNPTETTSFIVHGDSAHKNTQGGINFNDFSEFFDKDSCYRDINFIAALDDEHLYIWGTNTNVSMSKLPFEKVILVCKQHGDIIHVMPVHLNGFNSSIVDVQISHEDKVLLYTADKKFYLCEFDISSCINYNDQKTKSGKWNYVPYELPPEDVLLYFEDSLQIFFAYKPEFDKLVIKRASLLLDNLTLVTSNSEYTNIIAVVKTTNVPLAMFCPGDCKITTIVTIQKDCTLSTESTGCHLQIISIDNNAIDNNESDNFAPLSTKDKYFKDLREFIKIMHEHARQVAAQNEYLQSEIGHVALYDHSLQHKHSQIAVQNSSFQYEDPLMQGVNPKNDTKFIIPPNLNQTSGNKNQSDFPEFVTTPNMLDNISMFGGANDNKSVHFGYAKQNFGEPVKQNFSKPWNNSSRTQGITFNKGSYMTLAVAIPSIVVPILIVIGVVLIMLYAYKKRHHGTTCFSNSRTGRWLGTHNDYAQSCTVYLRKLFRFSQVDNDHEDLLRSNERSEFENDPSSQLNLCINPVSVYYEDLQCAESAV